MSDLKTLIKDIKETTKQANMVIEGGDTRTRPGREMARNAASGKLEGLRDTYKSTLNKSVFTILPSGKGSKEFAKLAKDFDALIVDGNEFYDTLAQRCQQTMGQRQTFGLTQFIALTAELRGFAKSNKIDFVTPVFTTDVQATDLEQVTEIVRDLVEKSIGQTPLKTYIEGQVLNLALEAEADTKVVPVVVLNIASKYQDSLIGTLFRGKGLQVDTNTKEVTPELIKQTFEQVKKLLKG